MQKLLVFTIFSCLVYAACQNNTPGEEAETPPTTEMVSLEKVWETDTLLTTAESVLYDAARNVIYVSCIGGVPPWTSDGDGFIARIDTSGNILERQWVTGLSAPKGIGLSGNTLYVNDIDRLVAIDVESGSIIKKMPVAEAKNLNDIAVGADGVLYLSDSQTSTAYKVVGEEVSTLVHDTIIGGLNGVFADGNRLLFAGFRSGNLFTYQPGSDQLTAVSDSMPGGDGIEKYGDGYFVSSWNGEVYYLDKDWNRTKLLDTKAQEVNAADIDVIAGMDLLLVPTFFANRVAAYRISGGQ